MFFTKFLFSMFVCMIFVTVIQAEQIRVANIDTYDIKPADHYIDSVRSPIDPALEGTEFHNSAGDYYINLRQYLQDEPLRGWLDLHYPKISKAEDPILKIGFIQFLKEWNDKFEYINLEQLQGRLIALLRTKVAFYNADKYRASTS